MSKHKKDDLLMDIVYSRVGKKEILERATKEDLEEFGLYIRNRLGDEFYEELEKKVNTNEGSNQFRQFNLYSNKKNPFGRHYHNKNKSPKLEINQNRQDTKNFALKKSLYDRLIYNSITKEEITKEITNIETLKKCEKLIRENFGDQFYSELSCKLVKKYVLEINKK